MDMDPVLSEVRRLVCQELAGLPVRVFLFGSWARGEQARSSDIDVAVEPLGVLPPGTLARLREALEQSSIPYRVDVVDLAAADADFRRRVHEEGVPWLG